MGIDRLRRSTAQRLRANATEAERIVWRALRNLPVYGSHFRRQVPIGRFVADFACLKARLIVELDGGSHTHDQAAARDAARTRFLEHEGYRVLRFWNGELVDNLARVLDTIYAALYGSPWSEAVPLPTRPRRAERADPPPQGEGQ